MPHRHYPPAYLRYLRARLWNLGRPGFWVTAIFLSVVGLLTWEYWSNPDIFVYKQKNKVTSQTPADSSLSAENRAIAADIDNLPVLFNDFEQATLSLTANTPKEKTEAKNSKSLLEDVIKKQKSAADAKLNPTLGVNGDTPPVVKNPFVVQTENLLRTGTVDNNNQFLGIKTLTGASEPTEGEQTSSNLGIGFTNQTNKNQNSASVSPLQAILNQSTNQKLSGFNGTTVTQTNALGRASEPGTTLMPPMNSLSSQNSLPSTGLTTGTGYTSTGRNLQQNPYSNLNNGQLLPNNGLNTGAGYTNLQQNPYNNLNNGQVLPNNGLNTGAGYTNLQQNPYNNLNNGQVVPNVAPGMPPASSGIPSNIAPYSNQIPSQGVVTPTNSMGYANYGLQQPAQLPQSNYGNYGLQQPTQSPQNYGNYVQQQPTQSNSLYLRQLRDKYRSPGQN
ncbi:hypothetical protein [Nostoc punctiforme]|uniref:Uncharacterized protein n=1 Tax=Nostoc punctiforme (strain ATCC 29133 / PCC 73102) TaxID=63737 RepID=B2IWA9_NOSP7|nr:hypothetical protein [Nostoc punctiforme]ACC79854.1 conserved hypothetical protein [Nostoc punctiforme PCC 73102]